MQYNYTLQNITEEPAPWHMLHLKVNLYDEKSLSHPAGVEVTTSWLAIVLEVSVLVDMEPVVPRRQTQEYATDPDHK